MESRSSKAAADPEPLSPAPPPHLSNPPPLHDPLPHPELLNSLGRMVRGLSLLFWGLPVALVVCVQSAKGDWFRPLGVIPSLVATGLLYYGLALLGSFQKQERPWIHALDRMKLVALINLGLSPFLYWWNRIPTHPFLAGVVEVLMLTGLLFLILLNPLLCRLTAMLPDETLRAETRLFSSVNCYVLITLLVVLTAYVLAINVDPSLPDRWIGWLMTHSPLPQQVNGVFYVIDRNGAWLVLFVILLPVAMTMALVWKIKEVILASIFGPIH